VLVLLLRRAEIRSYALLYGCRNVFKADSKRSGMVYAIDGGRQGGVGLPRIKSVLSGVTSDGRGIVFSGESSGMCSPGRAWRRAAQVLRWRLARGGWSRMPLPAGSTSRRPRERVRRVFLSRRCERVSSWVWAPMPASPRQVTAYPARRRPSQLRHDQARLPSRVLRKLPWRGGRGGAPPRPRR